MTSRMPFLSRTYALLVLTGAKPEIQCYVESQGCFSNLTGWIHSPIKA